MLINSSVIQRPSMGKNWKLEYIWYSGFRNNIFRHRNAYFKRSAYKFSCMVVKHKFYIKTIFYRHVLKIMHLLMKIIAKLVSSSMGCLFEDIDI